MSRILALAFLLALPAAAGAAPGDEPAAPATPAATEGAAAPAAQPPAVTFDPEGWLAIGGVAIIQLRDKSVNDSMRTRANRITGRLVDALWKINRDGRFRDIPVTIAPPAKEPWIVVNGVPVMKVTYQDVVATHRSPSFLANYYAACYRKALRRVYAP